MSETLEYINRIGTNCEKWDLQAESFGENGLMGLWVADMDFRVPRCVQEALLNYVNFGVYGYASPKDGYFDAFIAWEKEQHGYEVQRDWIRYSPGVVPGLNWCVQTYTKPGDAVIVMTPVYYPFLHAVKNNGRRLVTSELINDHGRYSADFADFEQKIAENDVKLFILCSPHNPVGRVWTKEELQTMMEICRRHNVFVVSDEIHHDLIFGERPHIPTATVGAYDDMLVTLTAPSKTFNLAGLKNSVVIIPDENVRAKFDKFAACVRISGGNTPGYVAAEAAWREGHDWLNAVKDVIRDNERYVRETLTAALPKLVISPLEGTYLLWIDFGAYLSEEELAPFFQGKCRLAFDYGSWFGGEGKTFIRMNLATSRENITEAVRRIVEAMK